MILKGTINRLWGDRFWGNGLIFFLGSFLAGFGNYLFQLLMARFLSRSDYGELQTLFALLGILSVPMAAVSVVIVREAARFNSQERPGKIRGLFSFFTRRGLLSAILLFVFFVGVAPFITKFLKLASPTTIFVLGLALFPLFLGSINRGLLQGLERFKSLSVLSLVEIGVKILLAVFLLKIGLAVKGVLGAAILAGIGGYFLTFLVLKPLFKGKEEIIEKAEAIEMAKYFLPVFLTILVLGLFLQLDMILVKHFFDPETAGDYGALVLLSRIVFFLVSPIIVVMFSLTAGAENLIQAQSFLKKTLLATLFLSLPVLFFYFLFPEIVIKILISNKFIQISPFLGWLGLAIFFYGLVQVFSQYFLSLGKKSFLPILMSGLLLETILISWRHENLWQVIGAINLAMAVTLAGLLVLYLKSAKGEICQN